MPSLNQSSKLNQFQEKEHLIKYGLSQPHQEVKRKRFKFFNLFRRDVSGEDAYHKQLIKCKALYDKCREDNLVSKEEWTRNNIAWQKELEDLYNKSLVVIKHNIELVKDQKR